MRIFVMSPLPSFPFSVPSPDLVPLPKRDTLAHDGDGHALETSLSTVQRDWKRAKAWLQEEMSNPTE